MRLVAYTSLTLLFFTSLVGCGGSQIIQPLEVGKVIPPLAVESIVDDQELAISSLKGDIVVLNFWSTSCGVCMQEIDDLKQIHETGKVKVVGVALDEDRERVRSVLNKRDVKYPVLMGDQATFERFDGYSIPYTIVIDRSQVVMKRFFGRMSEQDLEEVIASLPSI